MRKTSNPQEFVLIQLFVLIRLYDLAKNKKTPDFSGVSRVPGTGIEPVQPQWSQDFKSCASTYSAIRAKLIPFLKKRAGDETRTRDPHLGKVVLYQLSYSRIFSRISFTEFDGANIYTFCFISIVAKLFL
jgi:hypothetical protein